MFSGICSSQGEDWYSGVRSSPISENKNYFQFNVLFLWSNLPPKPDILTASKSILIVEKWYMNKSTHRTLKKKMNTDIKYSTIKGQTSTKQAHQHKISHELTNPSQKKPGGKNKTSWIFWVLEGHLSRFSVVWIRCYAHVTWQIWGTCSELGKC